MRRWGGGFGVSGGAGRGQPRGRQRGAGKTAEQSLREREHSWSCANHNSLRGGKSDVTECALRGPCVLPYNVVQTNGSVKCSLRMGNRSRSLPTEVFGNRPKNSGRSLRGTAHSGEKGEFPAVSRGRVWGAKVVNGAERLPAGGVL
ncbi:hypothetical protein GCM10010361_60420 [Streptomyces olivaceiscleroticus]|uniref:Uncharacterized protein n=1 Tax=Streptomyces olivaceiscleroticus TaxID=68245 RepID=A0ABP3KUV2_9ACTN